jgi:hypothetical protein
MVADRIDGIGESLPVGERLLWQGAPQWRALAVRRFHARKIALYFGVLVVWRFLAGGADGRPLVETALASLWLVVLGAAAVGLVCGFAVLVARTSVYAITDRRIVLRVGVALPSVINLPLRFVESAGVQPFGDGSGTISLRLERDNRFAWLLIWPHARPWRFGNPEPSLLCVPECSAVAETLRSALLLLAPPPPAAEVVGSRTAVSVP